MEKKQNIPSLPNWMTFAGGTTALNPEHNSYTYTTDFGTYYINPPVFNYRSWNLTFARNGKEPRWPKNVGTCLWHWLGNGIKAAELVEVARQHDEMLRTAD